MRDIFNNAFLSPSSPCIPSTIMESDMIEDESRSRGLIIAACDGLAILHGDMQTD
jgi:hypothetical protein